MDMDTSGEEESIPVSVSELNVMDTQNPKLFVVMDPHVRPRYDETIEAIKFKIFCHVSQGTNANTQGALKLTMIGYHPIFQNIRVNTLDRGEIESLEKEISNRILAELTPTGIIVDKTLHVSTIDRQTVKTPIDQIQRKFGGIKSQTELQKAQAILEAKGEWKKISTAMQKWIDEELKMAVAEEDRLKKTYYQNPLNSARVSPQELKYLLQTPRSLRQYKYSIINVLLEVYDPEGNFRQKDKTENENRIHLDVLWNHLRLSESMPFLSLGARVGAMGKPEALTKIWANVDKKLAEKWIFGSSVKNKDLKQPQGLVIRLKGSEASKSNYITINIFKTGTVRFRCVWTKDKMATFRNIELCIEQIATLIHQINEIRVAFATSELKLPIPTKENIVMGAIDTELIFNHVLQHKDILKKIKESTILKEFFSSQQQIKRKPAITRHQTPEGDETEEAAAGKPAKSKISELTLEYKKTGKRFKKTTMKTYSTKKVVTKDTKIQQQTAETSGKILTIFKRNLEYKNTSNIFIKNAKSIQQCNIVYDNVISLIKLVKGKDFVFVPESILTSEEAEGGQVKQGKKGRESNVSNASVRSIPKEKVSPRTLQQSKLQILRDAGVQTNVRSCQKKFQPIIDDGRAPHKTGYSIEVNGQRLICPKESHPNPGYTNKGIPCCFKRDQRDKPRFKQFHLKEEISQVLKDTHLISSRKLIIKTEKILLPGQVGIIPAGNMQRLLDSISNAFYRVGVPQANDKFSFFNAIIPCLTMEPQMLNSKTKQPRVVKVADFIDIISEYLTPAIFKTLQGGLIAQKFKTLGEYKKCLQNGGFYKTAEEEEGGEIKDPNTETLNNAHEAIIHVIDLISRVFNKNIFIINKSKIECLDDTEYDQNKNTIVLMHTFVKSKVIAKTVNPPVNVYEPIFRITKKAVYRFYPNDYPLISTLSTLDKKECSLAPVIEEPTFNVVRSKYFTKVHTPAETIALLTEVKHVKIIEQITNAYNETIYIGIEFLKGHLLIPTLPTGPILHYHIKPYIKKLPPKYIHGPKHVLLRYRNLSKLAPRLLLDPVEQILKYRKVQHPNNKVIAIVLACGGAPVPVRENKPLKTLPISTYNFAIDIDYILRKHQGYDVNIKMQDVIAKQNKMYHQLKYEISTVFNSREAREIKEEVQGIIVERTAFESKYDAIYKIVREIAQGVTIDEANVVDIRELKTFGACSENKSAIDCQRNTFCGFKTAGGCKMKIDKETMEAYISRITIEIIRDTAEQQILNKKLSFEIQTNVNALIKRSNEIILTNIKQVCDWLQLCKIGVHIR